MTDRSIFDKAKAQASLARRKLDEMRVAADIENLDQLWSEFLTAHQRFYTRMLKACEHGRLKGWYDGVKHQRRADELLKYVHHARNADEHGIKVTTQGVRSIAGRC